MNQEIKKLWLAELRNPERKQAQKRLNNGEGMCCLGVLCDVVKDYPEVQGSWVTDSCMKPQFSCLAWNAPNQPNEKVVGHLPLAVRKLADLEGRFGEYSFGEKVSLANLNDEGITFTEIADVIEKYF